MFEDEREVSGMRFVSRGPYGQCGKHSMSMMQVMDAKDIRRLVPQPEFDAYQFRLAALKMQNPNGTQLNPDMLR